MVFHGGSGSTKEEISTAVSHGVVKMNVDTDTQFAYLAGVRVSTPFTLLASTRGLTPRSRTSSSTRRTTSPPRSVTPMALTSPTRRQVLRSCAEGPDLILICSTTIPVSGCERARRCCPCVSRRLAKISETSTVCRMLHGLEVRCKTSVEVKALNCIPDFRPNVWQGEAEQIAHDKTTIVRPLSSPLSPTHPDHNS